MKGGGIHVREMFSPTIAVKFWGGALGAIINIKLQILVLFTKLSYSYSPASSVCPTTSTLSGPSPFVLTALTLIV